MLYFVCIHKKGYNEMIYKKIYLDENNKDVFLEAYIADKVGDFVRNAILVIPGGGYGCVCSDREGEPIAMAFMPYGYNAFVLHYSVGKEPFPQQLIEASWAMKHIRDNSDEYNIDPEKVFAVGFSAGGHLAASLGVMWNNPEIYKALDIPMGYNKPTGMMLIYPVISGKDFRHEGSFQNLLAKDNPTEEELAAVSIENFADASSSPAFIVHTSNDETVPVRNSIALADKLAQEGVKFELHIYPDAPHGMALGNKITKCGVEKWENAGLTKWVENAAAWAEEL